MVWIHILLSDGLRLDCTYISNVQTTRQRFCCDILYATNKGVKIVLSLEHIENLCVNRFRKVIAYYGYEAYFTVSQAQHSNDKISTPQILNDYEIMHVYAIIDGKPKINETITIAFSMKY